MGRISYSILLSVSCMAGCVSPTIHYEASGYDLRYTAKPPSDPQTMSDALVKLKYFEAVYHENIRTQQETLQNVNSGLVWLGAGIIALAAGNVHKDVILGGSLVGGTTYATSKTQLDARKVAISIEALEALGCAHEASIPLMITPERQAELVLALRTFRQHREALSASIVDLNNEITKVGALETEQIVLARALSARAAEALSAGSSTFSAADNLLKASRGLELSAAVDRINVQAIKALASIQPDISSVKQSLRELPQFSNLFSQGIGAGVEQAYSRFESSLASPGVKGAQGGRSYENLAAATRKLNINVIAFNDVLNHVKSLISVVDTAAVNAALKRCNVSAISLEISVFPANIEFEKGAQTRGLSISGGIAPYEIILLDKPADNSIVVSGLINDVVQIYTTDSIKAGTYYVRIRDAVKNEKLISLNVVAPVTSISGKSTNSKSVTPVPKKTQIDNKKNTAPPPPLDVNTVNGTPQMHPEEKPTEILQVPANSEVWNGFIAALKKPNSYFSIGEVMYGVESASSQGSALHIRIKCSKPPVSFPSTQLIKDRLVKFGPMEIERLQQKRVLDLKLSQLIIASSQSCHK